MTLEKYFSQVTVVEHKIGVKEAVATKEFWLEIRSLRLLVYGLSMSQRRE
jgi:hypothetical protein